MATKISPELAAKTEALRAERLRERIATTKASVAKLEARAKKVGLAAFLAKEEAAEAAAQSA